MRNLVKRAFATAMTASFIFGACGCSFLKDAAPDEVIDAADAYAKLIADCNLSKMKKASDKDFDKKTEDWAELLDFSEGDIYNDNAAAFAAAVADTIAYEIDEESVEASTKKGEGSVDVIFTMADYEDLLDDDGITDIDMLTDAIEDADTQEIKVTLEFEGEDGDWLVTNYDKVFDKVYVFTDVTEITYRLPIADCLDYTQWNGCDNNANDGYYTNTTYIDFEMYCDWSIVDVTEIYYTVEFGGSEIYRLDGSNLGYFQTGLPGAPLDDSGYYLADGDYVITFYDAVDDSIIVSGTAHVLVDVAPEPTPVPTPDNDDSLIATDCYVGRQGEIEYYYDYGPELIANVDNTTASWYEYGSDYGVPNGTYPAGTTTIQFSFKVNEEMDVEYKAFYLSDGYVSSSYTVLGREAAELSTYGNGTYADCNIDITDTGSGYYVIGVYEAGAADSDPCIVAVCYVE